MSIGLLCDYLDIDELGIKKTAEELGIELRYIPFRKVSITMSHGGFKLIRKEVDYSQTLDHLDAILNRTQSKNRRLLAASFAEALDKPQLNPLRVEFLCFSKFRTLFELCRNGVSIPRTMFVPCNPSEEMKDGGKVHNEEEIADLIESELGESLVVIKPDAGTHGREVTLSESREKLLRTLKAVKPSIINPVGVLAQEFVQKWFYDLRIIVFKEKGKPPCCYPRAMARAGLEDFRTNASLGNFVFHVDLPLYVKDAAVKCGEIIGRGCDAWLIALDAMVRVGENKIANDHDVKVKLERLAPLLEVVKKIRDDQEKKKNFLIWNTKLEESFQEYKSSKAYEDVQKIINESVEQNKHGIVFHEANSCPEFWEQTRLATGANVAEHLLLCAKSLINSEGNEKCA